MKGNHYSDNRRRRRKPIYVKKRRRRKRTSTVIAVLLICLILIAGAGAVGFFILQEYFHKDIQTATRIMLKVHHEGKGVCGIFPRDIASTKVKQVIRHARQEGHPLQCTMEEA